MGEGRGGVATFFNHKGVTALRLGMYLLSWGNANLIIFSGQNFQHYQMLIIVLFGAPWNENFFHCSLENHILAKTTYKEIEKV